ncbi:hypothetical protein FHW58_002969 [Duganella sp. 1224]|uniref:hypothetical protein n=1 Tax=Duganella sp. 1224 TaxID=2587052 RepID=UPI0015CBEA91|nr:hypothetical protein [Duganella sp. 1224]NYE61762.1 hypothetical protein [Duganella sp. 1224]
MVYWVAWSEIIAGVFMLIDVCGRLFAHGVVGPQQGVFCALGAVSLVAGVRLLRRVGAAWLGSVVLQVFLLPVFSVGTVVFRPGLGFFLPVGIQDGAPYQELSIGVDFMVDLDAGAHARLFAVNVVAVACLVALWFKRRSLPPPR